MVMITAHGGAMRTGRNTQKYFDEIHKYEVDAIEVDIWSRGDTLYLSHAMPRLRLGRAIRLEYVLEYCKKHNLKVNCDVKRRGLVKPVVALAKRLNAENYIYFTGAVRSFEIAHLTAGEVYVNNGFYSDKFALSKENLPQIKSYLDSFNNPRIKGLNIHYRNASDELIDKAHSLGLGLSVYTVDNKEVLARLLAKEVDNITTNIVDVALKLKERRR
ncbi:MAG: glycerophosphodiester phosphodiesterase [Clostridia bacterium]